MANNEKIILASAIKSRTAFERLSSFIDKTDAFGAYGSSTWEEIARYYDTDKKATRANLEIIKQRLIKEQPKKEYLINEFLLELPEDVSETNVIKLYEDLRKDQIRNELILALNAKDDKKSSELIEQLQTFRIEEEQEEIYNGVSVQELEVHFNKENLIPIFPSALSEALGGGVPKQTQLCIFARPDVGKTVVAINMAVAAAELGKRVLYIGNEDPSPVMVLRTLTRFVRRPAAYIRENMDSVYKDAIEKGYKNLYFKPMHPGTIKEIRYWVDKIRPDMLVVDQIRNLNLGKEGLTQTLEEACIKLRNLGKEFDTVNVCVTQAGESAHNKIRLEYEDVEWSNTGVAAQMDLMIGVGQNEDLKNRGVAVMSFPKNKITAPLQPMTVNIDYTINRVTVSQ